MPQSQMLELTHEKLGWPESAAIWYPSGAGPKVYAGLAKKKIGEKIKREFPEATEGIKVSVLAANPKGNTTEAPLAIICQFTRPVSNQQLLQRLHQLAWSFCRARSLIIVEPQLLRVWSCCEPPKENTPVSPVFEENDLSSQAANALQWVELVSGEFFQKNESRFKRTGAADQMLLSNLKELRRQLENDGLAIETIHDLLARIIFIQFLFQKQDSDGTPALNLNNLHKQGILSTVYTDLPGILNNFDDTYNLFRWLNNKFNGDLFPGKGKKEPEREADWQTEIQKVYTENNRYLTKLAEFVRGDLDMGNNQLCLWKFYSFDVIPLDFISSIYEEFVQKNQSNNSVHYTPEYIVDFILDGVLPWNETNWDLKILDPACGSGIFLVKAFQRLIYRWELAHKKRISAEALVTLLKNNLFGIDIEKEAVRVASFSLYMTMLDSIDPLEYWENEVRFPPMRGHRLIAEDFFREDKEGFRTGIDANTYDLVLGNAPWGKNSVKDSDYVEAWKKRPENHGKWQDSYGNIGPLFLPKAAALTKKLEGIVSMIQPAMSLLFNQSEPAKNFRHQLFSEFKIEEVVNLSALRFGIFKDAISPSCIITLRNLPPDNDSLTYICPKPNFSDKEGYSLVIEAHDVNFIYPDEASSLPFIWSTLMWGGRRDLAFIKSLGSYPTIASLSDLGVCIYSQGIKIGKRTVEHEPLRNRHLLKVSDFDSLKDTDLYLTGDELSINQDVKAEGPRIKNHKAFDFPQLIIKQSWITKLGRFKAVLVRMDGKKQQGVLCTESFISINTKSSDSLFLENACLTYNSKFAVYYLFLTSGRFSSFIHEIKPNELVGVPLPETLAGKLDDVDSLDDIDNIVFQSFSFKHSEQNLIDDLTKYTLLDFKGNNSSPGRKKTSRRQEQELTDYCECFFRVIKAGFGKDKNVCATIFQEPDSNDLPVRLVAIHLNQPIHNGVKIEPIDSQNLLEHLQRLNDLFLQQDANTGGIFYQRIARIYESYQWQGEQVPTIYLIKPDKIRYWTRSMALRDADEVSADIMFSAFSLN
jgi:hypothetical protein